MIVMNFKMLCFFFLILIALGNCDNSIPMAEGKKNITQRATSCAYLKGTLFLTLVDIMKEHKNGELVMQKDSEYIKVAHQSFITPVFVRTDGTFLWILDSAVENINGKQIKSQATLFKSKLNAESVVEILAEYKIPQKYTSFPVTFALDSKHLYIADFNKPALIVLIKESGIFHTFHHHFFHPSPLSNPPEYTQWTKNNWNGLFGVTVSHQFLYFHPLASKNEFRVALNRLWSPSDLTYNDATLFASKPSESGVSVYADELTANILNDFTHIAILDDHGIYENTSFKLEANEGIIMDVQLIKNNQSTEVMILIDSEVKFSIQKISLKELLMKKTNNRVDISNSAPRPYKLLVLKFTFIFILTILCR